ncbi:hypothetical protein SLS55_010233 [Diplodia seriata]|uniref:BTB domain-containing protein n=1 Tax=Diplodia seriata TaxID=420778 RepID=A0ABR3BYQ7_9PEZI
METFQAGTFNFYIGPDRIHFILYKNLVSRYSEPLGSMMTNGMKESQEGAAYLEHVDPGTFCRFAEFIHSGDYSTAAPTRDPNAPYFDGPAPPPEDDSWRGFAFSSSKKKKKKKGRGIPIEEPAVTEYADEPPAAPEPVPEEGYWESEAQDPELKELAERKLSRALKNLGCFLPRMGDICNIIRLVYNHEDGDTHPSPLHSIISDFATNYFQGLMASKNFRDLLAEGGSFPPDVCRKVARLLD